MLWLLCALARTRIGIEDYREKFHLFIFSRGISITSYSVLN